MALFQSSQIRPIGLDIGHSSIKMIQLCRDKQSVRVFAAAETPIDPELYGNSEARRDFIVSSLRRMRGESGFSGRQVVSCLPGDVMRIKSLRLDTDRPDEIENFMFTEVARRFGLNPDVDELRYMTAGSVFQGEQIKNEVIFFGVEHAALSDHIDMLEEAQLEPVAVDTIPCALFRSFQSSLRRREDQDVVSVLVDLGSHFTTVIIGKGPQIIFIKQIPLAGEQLTCDVAAKLGISVSEASLLRLKLRTGQMDGIEEETVRAVVNAMTVSVESLAREIALCFKYYAVTFRGGRPMEAIFTGGEAYESSLIDALRRHLGVQIRIAEPLRGFDLEQEMFNHRLNPQMCEWTVAAGLGLKGWDGIENDAETQSVAEEAV